MLRTIWIFIYFWAYLIYLIPSAIRIDKLKGTENIQKQNELLHKTSSAWGKSLIRQTSSNVHVLGMENLPEGPVLFVSNHQGYFDIPLLLGFIDKPKGFIAKKELADIPVFGKWIARIKSVFIDRDNARQSLRAFQKASEFMEGGYSMVIFPEGTRSKGHEMNEFKRGSLKLATRSGMLIVPVAINGSHSILEANNYMIQPAEVFIKIFEPIDPKKLTKAEEADLAEIVHNKIKNYLDSKGGFETQ